MDGAVLWQRAGDFLKSQLEDAVVFIPYGSMVDEFQHIVYDHPEMTPAERKDIWQKLEKQYKPHLTYEEESSFYSEGGFWQRQHHIYSFPFYYIDYVIAQKRTPFSIRSGCRRTTEQPGKAIWRFAKPVLQTFLPVC